MKDEAYTMLARVLVLVVFLFVSTVSLVHGQVRGTDIRSAEAQAKIRQYNSINKLGLNKTIRGEFLVTGLKVGYSGTPTFVACKVVSVVDETNLIANLYDVRGSNRQTTTVWLKVISTEYIVDGMVISHGNSWLKKLGGNKLKVVGTKRYKTVLGNTRTVYEIEVYKD